MYKYTYGYWDLVRNEVRNCNALTFNWAAFSRTTDDIKKRCDFLITQFSFELYGSYIDDSNENKPKISKNKVQQKSDDESEDIKSENENE